MNDDTTAAVVGLSALGLAVVASIAAKRIMSPKLTIPYFDVPADPYAPNEPVTRYDPASKPGVVAFSRWVIDELGGTDLGIGRALPSGDSPSSKHHEGRAWDWGPPSGAAASVLLDALLRTVDGDAHALARRAGLRVIIWQRRIWTAGTQRWNPYYKADPHTGHIHFGFGWDGALGKTSLYELIDGSVAVSQLEGVPDTVPSMDGVLVDAVLTPMSDRELAEALAAAHVQVFGKPPSYNRLGIAWAQVAFESGHTRAMYNHNFGNIKRSASWPGDWFRWPELNELNPMFRSYPAADAGAAGYWRLLARRYPAALEAFDEGDAPIAALELRNRGYYTAPLHIYRKGLSQLFEEYRGKFKPKTGYADIIAPLLVVLAAAGAIGYFGT